MLIVKTDKKGFQDIRDMILGMKLRMDDVREVAPLIHSAISKDVRERFAKSPFTQRGGYVPPGNIYWSRLKKSTLAARPDRLNKKIMIDKGLLLQSMFVGTKYNLADTYYRNIRFGSKLPYAHKQNLMRHYLFLHPKLLNQIKVILKLYVKYGKQAVQNVKHNNLDIQEQAFEDNLGVSR